MDPPSRQKSSASAASSPRSHRVSVTSNTHRPEDLPERFRRASETSVAGTSKHEESLINALEAEEERLVNNLTRKLEKLRADKFNSDVAVETENECMVNKLQRKLSSLQEQNRQLLDSLHQSATSSPSSAQSEHPMGHSPNVSALSIDPLNPSPAVLVDSLQAENNALRRQLDKFQTNVADITAQNDIFRTELIELRRKLGMNIDELVGMTSSGAGHHPSSSSSEAYSARDPSLFTTTESSSPSTSYLGNTASPGSPSFLHQRVHNLRGSSNLPNPPPPSLASSLTSSAVVFDDEDCPPSDASRHRRRRSSDYRIAEQGQLQRSRGASNSSGTRPTIDPPHQS